MHSAPVAAQIEHSGIVRRVADGRIFIAVSVSGCDSCGHGSACGMSKLMRKSTSEAEMVFPLAAAPQGGLQAGDAVVLRMPEAGSGLFAVIGYLLPALALLLGAALGNAWGGDPGTALGAIAAFALTLLMLRLAAGRLPWLLPRPQIARAPAPEFSQPRLDPTSRRLP